MSYEICQWAEEPVCVSVDRNNRGALQTKTESVMIFTCVTSDTLVALWILPVIPDQLATRVDRIFHHFCYCCWTFLFVLFKIYPFFSNSRLFVDKLHNTTVQTQIQIYRWIITVVSQLMTTPSSFHTSMMTTFPEAMQWHRVWQWHVKATTADLSY